MKNNLTLVVNNAKTEPMNAVEWDCLLRRIRMRQKMVDKKETRKYATQ